MRLKYVEIAGFRGFRGTGRIEVPRGFLVVTGRNGTGKSTICDAIEFVLTGTIDKYAYEKGGKESLVDYIWWRGEGAAEGHYVTVGFEDENGGTVAVTRSRENGVDPESLAVLERRLCSEASKPPDALRHLCRTSIIRDELIAATSLDLSDPARFEFVRSALGAIAHGDVADRVHEAATAAEADRKAAEKEAEVASSRLRTTLAELTDARVVAARAVDLETAMAVLRVAVGQSEGSVAEVLAASRAYLAARRATSRKAEAVLTLARDIEHRKRDAASTEFATRKRLAAERLDAVKVEHSAKEKELEEAQKQLAQQREQNAVAASLSLLLEHGSSLGLDHGHCPLCRSERTDAEWSTALGDVAEAVARVSSALADANARVAELRPQVEESRRGFQAAQTEAAECDEIVASTEREEGAIQAQWRDLSPNDEEMPPSEEIEERLATERDNLIEVERHMLVLEASQAIDRVSQLEMLADTIRGEVDATGNRVAAAQSAAQALIAAEKAVRRVNAEMVDERLASMSPSLSELYYRLRPHDNWREMDYAIRGDVRRFLSLRVGEGLNPQFIFSSGQRRAAGLAFLLSVHLSRPWCEWQTLVLDDPVQHIDDFRALQLVEVLSACRKDDRQVVCAVEDPALADVLCRRFRSTQESPGARLELGFDVAEGSKIISYEAVMPFPQGVLRTAGAA